MTRKKKLRLFTANFTITDYRYSGSNLSNFLCYREQPFLTQVMIDLFTIQLFSVRICNHNTLGFTYSFWSCGFPFRIQIKILFFFLLFPLPLIIFCTVPILYHGETDFKHSIKQQCMYAAKECIKQAPTCDQPQNGALRKHLCRN